MTPHTGRKSISRELNRRSFLASLGTLGLGALSGCANPLFRGQTPEAIPVEEEKERKLVGDFTRPSGLNAIKVESIALVTSLDNTGSDPPPSEQRQLLLAEMQTHEVANASKLLASPTTSMVLVTGYLPPGVQERDTFDLEVRIPKNSETTSLAGGWLMPTRLRRMQVLGGVIRSGDVDGVGRGNIVVNAILTGETDKTGLVRGRILGGGMALESRKFGLMMRREDASIRISTLIGKAINARFHTLEKGQKQGVAKPMRDNFLELAIAPRYKHNLGRYLRVVRNITIQESMNAKVERLQVLGRKLQEPSAAPLAALQLEAIGREGIEALKAGLANTDPEVRFYAAEALAYLDQPEAAPALEVAARESSAFRWHALTALASMNHPAAYTALSKLLHEVSSETRYGAFRALRQHNAEDPETKGELLAGRFFYHTISTTTEPLVHVTRSKHPEVVLFGHEQTIKAPQFLYAGKHLMLKGQPDGQIKVSRFKPDEEDKAEVCSASLDQVIRTVVNLGGSYADVIAMLTDAQKQGLLQAKFVIEAIPRIGRQYYRENDENESGEQTPGAPGNSPTGEASANQVEAGGLPQATLSAATPDSELFIDRLDQAGENDQERESTETYIDPEYLRKDRGILDKLNPWPGK